MHPLRVIRLPIRDSQPAASFAEFPKLTSRIRCIAFEMKFFRDAETIARFYECMSPGCRGAGCPTFSRTEAQVPQGILDHLERHAGLCEGVQREEMATPIPPIESSTYRSL